MKNQILHLFGQIKKFNLLFAIQFFNVSIANAQDDKWPVALCGSKGATYGTAPVISGYLIVNANKRFTVSEPFLPRLITLNINLNKYEAKRIYNNI